jgi:hypothetical protein
MNENLGQMNEFQSNAALIKLSKSYKIKLHLTGVMLVSCCRFERVSRQIGE